MKTATATQKKSAIEIKVMAINLLNQYAKKYTEYEQNYFNQFMGKGILKVDGSVKAKYEHEKLSDKIRLPEGYFLNAHYWFEYGYNSFNMRIKICVNGGSYDNSTAFCQYEESAYTIFDTDKEGLMIPTERFNNDYTQQYNAEELTKQANEVRELAEKYEAAERSIPHYFRGVLNVQRLSYY